VRAYASDATFLDIGTPIDYLQTSLRLAARNGDVLRGERTQVDVGARVVESVLWDEVTVEASAMLRECVVTDGARVPAGTSWTGTILRRADGPLCPGEERVGDLAIAPITKAPRPTSSSQGPTSNTQNT
jgi:NDP-sugar pyrophosphorylase family protein